jgi:acyl-CoA reductase-like NAD-dependent aldehyde dehydrogenase
LIQDFTTEEEALEIANDSIYGLAASVFSADETRCERVARALRAGIVWKNCSQPASFHPMSMGRIQKEWLWTRIRQMGYGGIHWSQANYFLCFRISMGIVVNGKKIK